MWRIIFLELQLKTIPNTYLTLVVGLEAPPALKSGHGAHKGTPRTQFGSCPRRVAGGCRDSCWLLAPASPVRSIAAHKKLCCCARGHDYRCASALCRCGPSACALRAAAGLSRLARAARRPPCHKQHRILVSAVVWSVRSSSLVGADHLAAAGRTSCAQFSQHSLSAASSVLPPARMIRTGRRWVQSERRGPCSGRGKGTWRCAAVPDRARYGR